MSKVQVAAHRRHVPEGKETVPVRAYERAAPETQKHYAAEGQPGVLDPRITPPKTFAKTGRYVIQLHHAARAGKHLDLRFNLGTGKAISFAGRQLPERGEQVKVVAQPDHPIHYMDFEGTLTGYGAGTVKRFLDQPIEIHEGLAERLVFSVHGHRRSEDYALIKVGDKIWLLRNFSPPRQEVKPHLFKLHYRKLSMDDLPMDDPDLVFSTKIDGAHSVVVLATGKHPRVYSYRLGSDGELIEYTHKIPGLFQQKWRGKLTVLRGEVYGVDKEDRAVPNQLLGGILNAGVWRSRELQKEHGVRLRVGLFDATTADGKDVAKTGYTEKLDFLKQVKARIPEFVIPTLAETKSDKERLLQLLLHRKLKESKEGVVIQRLSQYAPPTKAKFRDFWDVYIREIYPAGGGMTGKAAGGFRYSQTPHGPLLGSVGTGFSLAVRQDMLKHPEKWTGKVAKVKSPEQFPGGALRAPAYKELHWEKSAADQEDFRRAVRAWQKQPRNPRLTTAVLKHVRPLVRVRARDYPMINPDVVTAEYTRAALRGLQKYKPRKGTSPSTWTVTSMQEGKRSLLRRATPLRIPDARLQLVGKSRQEGAEKKLGKRLFALLQKETKGVLLESKDTSGGQGRASPRATEVWRLLRPELSPAERQMYDLLNRAGGLSGGELARRLRVSQGRISQLRGGIHQKMEKYLDGKSK